MVGSTLDGLGGGNEAGHDGVKGCVCVGRALETLCDRGEPYEKGIGGGSAFPIRCQAWGTSSARGQKSGMAWSRAHSRGVNHRWGVLWVKKPSHGGGKRLWAVP